MAMNEHIETKDIDSFTRESGWAVVSQECEYEAWTSEGRFRRVYHLAPCEEIVVLERFLDADLLAKKIGGNIVAVTGGA